MLSQARDHCETTLCSDVPKVPRWVENELAADGKMMIAMESMTILRETMGRLRCTCRVAEMDVEGVDEVSVGHGAHDVGVRATKGADSGSAVSKRSSPAGSPSVKEEACSVYCGGVAGDGQAIPAITMVERADAVDGRDGDAAVVVVTSQATRAKVVGGDHGLGVTDDSGKDSTVLLESWTDVKYQAACRVMCTLMLPLRSLRKLWVYAM